MIDDNIGNKKDIISSFIPNIDLLRKIYFASIIDIESFHKTCVLISMKTSNTQSECENMPFYVFNNFMVFFNEISEKENNNNKDTDGDSGEAMNKQATEMMSKSKSLLPNTNNFKIPKL